MNYILYGEEHCLLQEAMQRIIKEELGTIDDMNLVTYNAQTVTILDILDDAQTIPFFADKKVIIVNNANFLSGSNDTDIDTGPLEAYLKNPMPSTVLIFTGGFAKLDARKKIVKQMQKCCRVLQFAKLDEQAKLRYLQQEIKERKLTISNQALQLMDMRLPCDIGVIRHELDKLSLYGSKIELEDVKALITRPLEEDVFQLVNAVVVKDLKKAFQMWQDLCVLNKDAIFLTAILSSQFRFLYQVKVLQKQGNSERDITSQLKAHPFRVKMAMKSVYALSADELLAILNQLATLDQKMKMGLIDKKLGFEMFLLQMQGVRNA